MAAAPGEASMAIVCREADRRSLPVISQSGGRQPDNPAQPANFELVLVAYPNCRVVLAHVGMGAEEEVARLANTYPNLYTDTSYWLGLVGQPGQFTPAEAADLFRRIGVDRVLFGTNYPICD